MQKIGFLIGRFQPFHLGHELIVREMIASGCRPCLLLGCPYGKNEKNPYSFRERVSHINSVFDFEKVGLMAIHDYPCDKLWSDEVMHEIHIFTEKEETPELWYYPKPQDKTPDGKHYIEELFNGRIKLIKATWPEKLGIVINATDIRADIHGNRHFLHPNVAKMICG